MNLFLCFIKLLKHTYGHSGSFAPSGTTETNYERRRRTCREALEAFRASSDHPSDTEVANGAISIREALNRGFSSTFAGHRLVFFTKGKIADKYDGRGEGWKVDLIPEMIRKRGTMQPRPHSGDQTAFVESRSQANAGKPKLVAIADTATGVVVHVGRESEIYVRDHYKK